MSIEYVDKLILFSIKKKNLLNSFLEKTKAQKETISDETMISLNKILIEKDEIMKEIDEADIEYLKIYQQLKEKEGIEEFSEINVDKFENLKMLKQVTVDISNLLSEIDLVDKENIKIFQGKFEDVKSELKSVKTVQNAYKGYASNKGGSMLIDERK